MIFHIVTPGEAFGQISFITSGERGNSAVTDNGCTLYSLSRSVFLRILKEFPSDYEKFCMIRDLIVLGQNTLSLDIKCASCNRYGHSITKCPLLHLIIDREKVILKSIFSNPQSDRGNLFSGNYAVKQRREKSFPTFKNRQYVVEQAEELTKVALEAMTCYLRADQRLACQNYDSSESPSIVK
jgi:hypothetical protein